MEFSNTMTKTIIINAVSTKLEFRLTKRSLTIVDRNFAGSGESSKRVQFEKYFGGDYVAHKSRWANEQSLCVLVKSSSIFDQENERESET